MRAPTFCLLLLTACHDLELPATKASQPEAPNHAPAPRRDPVVSEASAPPSASAAAAPRDVRKPTRWQGDDSVPGALRAEAAARNREKEVRRLFDEAGVAFPPAELFVRVFKAEGELEAWASSEKGDAMRKIATYEICRMSGDVGPKRREGDMQVPEGFYRIDYFWPDSAFYLAGKVSYPNALDRQLGGTAPGGDIMIHGGCASIGCIAMSDERIEELYVMGTSLKTKGARVAVHIFPTRDLHGLIASGEHPEHQAFWANLAEGLDAFEKERRVPTVTIGWKGRYEIEPAGT